MRRGRRSKASGTSPRPRVRRPRPRRGTGRLSRRRLPGKKSRKRSFRRASRRASPARRCRSQAARSGSSARKSAVSPSSGRRLRRPRVGAARRAEKRLFARRSRPPAATPSGCEPTGVSRASSIAPRRRARSRRTALLPGRGIRRPRGGAALPPDAAESSARSPRPESAGISESRRARSSTPSALEPREISARTSAGVRSGHTSPGASARRPGLRAARAAAAAHSGQPGNLGRGEGARGLEEPGVRRLRAGRPDAAAPPRAGPRPRRRSASRGRPAVPRAEAVRGIEGVRARAPGRAAGAPRRSRATRAPAGRAARRRRSRAPVRAPRRRARSDQHAGERGRRLRAVAASGSPRGAQQVRLGGEPGPQRRADVGRRRRRELTRPVPARRAASRTAGGRPPGPAGGGPVRAPRSSSLLRGRPILRDRHAPAGPLARVPLGRPHSCANFLLRMSAAASETGLPQANAPLRRPPRARREADRLRRLGDAGAVRGDPARSTAPCASASGIFDVSHMGELEVTRPGRAGRRSSA